MMGARMPVEEMVHDEMGFGWEGGVVWLSRRTHPDRTRARLWYAHHAADGTLQLPDVRCRAVTCRPDMSPDGLFIVEVPADDPQGLPFWRLEWSR